MRGNVRAGSGMVRRRGQVDIWYEKKRSGMHCAVHSRSRKSVSYGAHSGIYLRTPEDIFVKPAMRIIPCVVGDCTDMNGSREFHWLKRVRARRDSGSYLPIGGAQCHVPQILVQISSAHVHHVIREERKE